MVGSRGKTEKLHFTCTQSRANLRLFERGFAATRSELKISDSLDVFAMEVEIPTDQESKFNASFKGKTLAREMDKLHGIEPALCSWIDAKLANLMKSGGSTSVGTSGISLFNEERSSVNVIKARIEMLEKCSASRAREVTGISELSVNIMDSMTKKFDDLSHRIDCKVYEKCGAQFDAAEYRIFKVLRDELSFLATPHLFEHPPRGIPKVCESGAQQFLKALRATQIKEMLPQVVSRAEEVVKEPITRTIEVMELERTVSQKVVQILEEPTVKIAVTPEITKVESSQIPTGNRPPPLDTNFASQDEEHEAAFAM